MRSAKSSVLMVTYQYAPAVDGGAERQAQRLAEGLAERGRHVAVVTARFPGLPAYEVLGGVEVHRVWAVPKPGRMSITFLPTLAAFLITGGRRFDIWHAHQAYYNAGLSLSIGRFLGKHCVVKAATSGPYGDLARLRRSPIGRWVKHMLPKADAVISLNSDLTEELVAAGIDAARVRLIPNGVDCVRFSLPSPQDRREARATLGVSPDAALVVYAGRLSEDKGVDYLLDAWRIIEHRFSEKPWTLFVAGAGAQSNRYRDRGERELRNAQFLGKVPDVRPLLHAADVLVLPSLSEGLSNIALEAMATGLPVVGTDIGGLREQIDDGVTGLLATPRDAEALVEGLTTVLGNSELRKRLGGAGRVRVVQRYSLTSMVDAYDELYDGLVQERIRRRSAASAP